MNDLSESPRQDISLLAMAGFIRRHIRIIASCVLLGGIAAGAASFLLTPRYRAEVVFSPVNSSGLGSELGGSLGGLAAIAGVTLGGASKRSDEALEYLRSRQFTRTFIERHGLVPLLYANRWDAAHGRWRGEAPTIAQAVDRFSHKVLQITQDHRTGIVTLAVLWRDRAVAAQWANWLVAEADAALRARAIDEFRRSIDFLKQAAAETSVVEVQTAVAKTMETELKDAMLARTRDAYAFKVLDPAVVRDLQDTDSPNRPLIVAVGGGFGLLIGLALAARHQRRSRVRASRAS
jgi:uncharacterized protein involved in exopolysaccharide biosynthesis